MRESTAGKIHLSTKTLKEGVCGANKKPCPFGGSMTKHYETKEFAARGREVLLTAQTMDAATAKKLWMNFSKTVQFEHDPKVSTDFVGARIKGFTANELDKTEWTEEQKQALQRLDKISDILKKKRLTKADWETLEDELSHIEKTDTTADNYDTFNAVVGSISAGLVAKRKNYDAFKKKQADYAKLPPLPENDRVMGLDEAQSEMIDLINNTPYDDGTVYYSSYKEDFELAMKRYNAGERFSDRDSVGTPQTERLIGNPTSSLVHPSDSILQSLENEGSTYLNLAFPRRELKDAMEKQDLNGVSVTPVYNGRESGNAYTVMQPDGSTRTLSIYEYRNTDSIIINGKENWAGKDTELPRSGDRAQHFFAEFSYADRQQAADSLVFMLKQAQKGELESDNELLSKAQRLDWAAILKEKVPGYKEWHVDRYGSAPKMTQQEQDDATVRKLLSFSDED